MSFLDENDPVERERAVQSVATTVRIMRKALRLPLASVAEQAGIGISHLSQIERGVKGASEEVYRKLAVALDLPEEFLLQVPERTKPENRDREADRLIATLTRVREAMADLEVEIAGRREKVTGKP